MRDSLRVRFSKYHGLGNDFLLLDLREAAEPPSAELVRRLCDRHLGIGADGILAIHRPSCTGAHLKMVVHNADGSVPETCGNGIRCVAFHAVRSLPDFAEQRTLRVETDAGTVEAEILARGDFEGSVRVAMGRPHLEAAKIPVASPLPGSETVVSQPLEVDGRRLRLTALSFGNPHAVIFEGASAEEAARLGPSIERHPAFPEGVNVGFARVEDGQVIHLTVWERGAGLTRACGSGACAAAVAGVLEGRVDAERPIKVHLPGGELQIDVRPDLSLVSMAGPARFVFEGTVDLAALEEALPCA